MALLEESYKGIEEEYNRRLKENNTLLEKNNDLRNSLEEIIALYDITKVICKYLGENKVFNLFKDELNKYIRVQECIFVENDDNMPEYDDVIVIPLEIDKSPIGCLIAKGVPEEDKEKFNILAQQFVLGIKRAILYHRVAELAITDSVTGVLSRRYCLERFGQELERSKKFKYSFSFLMIDIDNFKIINDSYGHLVGDAVLKEIAKRIKENIRQIDLVGRYGGEEFSVILIETDKSQAKFAAERIRASIEEKYIGVYDENLKVTISIGICVFPADAHTAGAIIEKADHALYRAKQSGKNRVCF